MSLPLKLNFSDYDNFLTDPNFTTSAEAQDYFRNMDMLVEALIDVGLWQPETNYPNGHVVFSPNMPNGTEAVCVATTGGKSSNVEPSWGEVGGDNVSDGTCFWKLRWKHWSKEVASVDDMKIGTSNDKLVTPKLARLGQTATNRLPNTTYSVGNVVYNRSNLSVAIKCTTAGTTSNTELDISGNNVGDTVTDGSVVWQVVSRVSDGMPVGFKYFDWVKEIPIGALGALYNRELYAGLWKSAQENKQVITEAEWQALAQANDGNVPWYSDGDGSTTFRVPALKCWVKGASGVEEVGNYLEAGLPNIEGSLDDSPSLSRYNFFAGNATGAFGFYADSKSKYVGGFQEIAPHAGLTLDASRSNSIYGNSDTVQPPSLVGIWLIKAFGTVTNVGNADVANVMQAVEQVQTGLGKVDGISDYIIESYRNETEWYEVYKSGKVRQGGYFSLGSGEVPVTLLKPYANKNYYFNAYVVDGMLENDRVVYGATNYSTTHITFRIGGDGMSTTDVIAWVAEGQGA